MQEHWHAAVSTQLLSQDLSSAGEAGKESQKNLVG